MDYIGHDDDFRASTMCGDSGIRSNGQNGLTAAVYVLAGVRIALCMMPQNQWLSADAPLAWGIYRNLPFALLGLVVIVLFYRSAKERGDQAFRWMWLTIVLSLGFTSRSCRRTAFL